MPTPKQDESEADFVDRCVPIVLDDGTADDETQAVAICHSLWKDAQGNAADAAPVRRVMKITELRVARGADHRPRIIGYAARFNRPSCDLGGFVERIESGAFARTLADGDDVRALIDHNPTLVLGRTKAGTLRLREDDNGLMAEIDPPDTTAAQDVMESIRRRDVDGMSFGFMTRQESWDCDADPWQRTLQDVQLFDVSVVTYPAYPDTSVAVRSLKAAREALAGRKATEAIKRRLAGQRRALRI